jgi:DNA-binding SARP family transcriptional activator
MRNFTDQTTEASAREQALEASHQLANMLSIALDRPVSRERLYSFIMSEWEEAARLAHIIHDADRRVKDRRRT